MYRYGYSPSAYEGFILYLRFVVRKYTNKVSDIRKKIHQELAGIYDDDEISAITRILFRAYTGWTAVELHLNNDMIPPREIADKLYTALEKLKRSMPVQYITGTVEFDGMILEVNRHVLIPRPETEELVRLVAADLLHGKIQDPEILDIGTGSGCIALSLKKRFPRGIIYGMDKYVEALQTARRNGEMNGLDVQWVGGDVLNKNEWHELPPAGVFVSNPPYIPSCEKESLAPHVRRYEPHHALIVPGDDPLFFYRYMGELFRDRNLFPGWFYAEIHENHGPQIREIFLSLNYSSVEILSDFRGKARFLQARV
jgi:release factor glutamine methyltransferase